MKPLPDFGPARIRICDACGRYVRCRSFHDRCTRCGGFVIHREWIEVIQAGVRVKIVNGEKTLEVGLETEDPTPIR